MDSFNIIFKKHRESATNEASNTKQNVNIKSRHSGTDIFKKVVYQ